MNNPAPRNNPFIDDDLAVCDIISRNPTALREFDSSCVTSDMLTGEGRIVFEFIRQHFTDYGKVPDKKTIQTSTKVLWDFESPEPLEYYLNKIHKRAILFRLGQAAKDMVAQVKRMDPDKAIASLKDSLHAIEKISSPEMSQDLNFMDSVEVRSNRYDTVSKLDSGIIGLPFPWPTLNEFTGGAEKSDLVMIVARTGLGKTWLLSTICAHLISLNKRVLFLTKELSPDMIALRLDSIFAGLPFDSIRRGTLDDMGEKARYREYLESTKRDMRYKNLNILSTISAKTVADIDYRLTEYRPDILLLDGVYIMQGENTRTARHEQREEVINGLKFLAGRHQVPVIGTAQFTREMSSGKAAENLRGGLADIGGSYGFAHWSDTVIAAYQNEELKKNNRMVMRLLKNRHGDPGEEIPLMTDYRTMQFKELPRNVGIDASTTQGQVDGKNKFMF